ncbi:MAG: DinB family protein [Bacteroidota bacterium]
MITLAYARHLWAYTAWAHVRVFQALESVATSPSPRFGQMVGLMSHVVRAEEVWLARIRQEPSSGRPLWPEDPLPSVRERAEASQAAWTAFLDSAAPHALTETVAYTNTRGHPFTSVLSDIVVHVAHHGTHHRGQVLTLLRADGHTPPALDYIYYTRRSA